jgi:hypothetical protein
MKLHTSSALLLGLFVSLVSQTHLNAQTVIASDSFTLNPSADPVRTNGAQLNTRYAEIGGIWAAQGGLRFNSNNTVYASQTGGAQQAVLPVSFTSGDTLELTWSVSRSQANWLGAGFNNGDQFASLTANGQVWANFTGTVMNIYMNGTATLIGSFTAGVDFNLSGGTYQTFSLILDTGANTVTATANGTTVLSNYSLGAFTPTFNTIAINVNNPQNNAGDAFNSISLSSIPEPSSSIFLIAAALGLSAFAIRKKR